MGYPHTYCCVVSPCFGIPILLDDKSGGKSFMYFIFLHKMFSFFTNL